MPKRRNPNIPAAADLRLEGQVGSDWFSEGITSRWVRDELANRNGGDLTVWLNSPGGMVIEGSAIYTALKEYPGYVTIKVDGMAASAASVIAMAADELCMSPTSYLMIHRASTWQSGNEEDMDEAARQLRAIDDGIVTAYMLKTGMSRNKLLEMMRDETWIPATQAVKLGFADRVLYRDGEEEPDDAALLSASAGARPGAVYACAGHKWKMPQDLVLDEIFLPKPAADPAPAAPEPAQPTDDTDELARALAVLRMHQTNINI